MKRLDINRDLDQLVDERILEGRLELKLTDINYLERLFEVMSFKPEPVQDNFKEFFCRYDGRLCGGQELRRRAAKAAVLACSVDHLAHLRR